MVVTVVEHHVVLDISEQGHGHNGVHKEQQQEQGGHVGQRRERKHQLKVGGKVGS